MRKIITRLLKIARKKRGLDSLTLAFYSGIIGTEMNTNCPVCKFEEAQIERSIPDTQDFYKCKNCGAYLEKNQKPFEMDNYERLAALIFLCLLIYFIFFIGSNKLAGLTLIVFSLLKLSHHYITTWNKPKWSVKISNDL